MKNLSKPSAANLLGVKKLDVLQQSSVKGGKTKLGTTTNDDAV